MNTQQFLALILPEGNNFFVLELDSKGYPDHHLATTPEEAAATALKKDRRPGSNIYFAMSSFKLPYYTDAGGKTKKRTQENVDRVKSFWLDLDVKGRSKDYPDQATAVKDIKRLCTETSLPLPTLLVNSGYGIHAYWVLTESISGEDWSLVAGAWRSTLDAHNIKHDSSCTTDRSRVLRPIGMHNRKADTPDVEVALIGRVRELITLEEFTSKLSVAPPRETRSFEALPLGGGEYAGEDMSMNEMAESMVEYRPSSILEIVKECSLIRKVGELRGNVSYPIWFNTLGLVKHTIEAKTAIHDFSDGHPGYAPEKAERKAESWGASAATCAVIERDSALELPGHCSGCKHRGTITSPIVLGYSKVLMTEVVRTVVECQVFEEIIEVPAIPGSMTHSFKWDNGKLWKSVVDKELTKTSDKTEFKWEAFCEFFFYPFSYFDSEEGKHVSMWRLREREGSFKDFNLTGGAIGAGGQALFKELGDQGVVSIPGGKINMEAYITNWASDIKKNSLGSESYVHFGWNGDNFVVGDTLISPDGEHRTVRLGGSAAQLAAKGLFEPRGSRDRWVELIDKAYNYEDQEQYQFILGAGFGSPLMHLMNLRGGAVVSAISHDSGQGKSTAAQLAMGIWGSGRPGDLTLTREQASLKAMYAMAGVLHSFPVVIDEMTNCDPDEISEMAYTFSQGSGRITLNQTGVLNLNRHSWASLMLTNANKSLTSIISSAKPGADAELARIIEFQFDNVSKLNKDGADDIFLELVEQYGWVGLEYITWVQKHRAEVKEMLFSVQKLIDNKAKLNRKDRFWSAGITVIIVGLMIANKLGLTRFNIAGIIRWVVGKIADMRLDNSLMVASPADCFNRMLNDLSPGLIVTDVQGDKRIKSPVFPSILREPRAPYTGRSVMDEARAYIIQPAIHKWCTTHQVSMRAMMTAAWSRGWLVSPEAVLRFPAKGTEISMGQFRCYIVDLEKMETSASADPTIAKVVSLMGRKRQEVASTT